MWLMTRATGHIGNVRLRKPIELGYRPRPFMKAFVMQ
jgi:hypothetical protein